MGDFLQPEISTAPLAVSLVLIELSPWIAISELYTAERSQELDRQAFTLASDASRFERLRGPRAGRRS